MESQIAQKVLIVGSGPVGLFLAYKLGKSGIKVDLIEKEDALSVQTRAGSYYGAACFALKDAGLLHLLADAGYVAQTLGWRTPVVDDGNGNKTWGDLVAHIPFDKADEAHPEFGMLLLPQSNFCQLLLEQALETRNVTVHFGTELYQVKENDDHVVAVLKDAHSGLQKDLAGGFLVGADGGRSTTRKCLGIELQGHTWPERLIATDVSIPNHQLPKVQPHFVIDPVNFAVIIPLSKPIEGKPSLWRYTIAINPTDNRADEEILSEQNIEQLYEKLMVGPRPLQYTIERKAIYHIHQRLVTTMSQGRCALAGDAAHLNNPFGAMGLTSGILDADALADTLEFIINGGHSTSLLKTYSDERRRVFQQFVDPTSTHNKLRVQCDPETAKSDWFIRLMKNPTGKKVDDFFLPYLTTWRTDMLRFTEVHQNRHL